MWLGQEDAGRKLTRERNLLLNLRSFLSEVHKNCNETRALQQGSPRLSAVATSPEPPSCEPHVSITTVSLAPGTHGDQTSFVWAALKKGQIVAWIPRFCFSSPSAAAFLTGSWTDRVVTSVPWHWCVRGEKPGKEKEHAEKLLGTPAPFYSLTWLVTWIVSWSFNFLLYFHILYTFRYICFISHLKRHLKINQPNCF